MRCHGLHQDLLQVRVGFAKVRRNSNHQWPLQVYALIVEQVVPLLDIQDLKLCLPDSKLGLEEPQLVYIST